MKSECDILESLIVHLKSRGIVNVWVEVRTPLGVADVVYGKGDNLYIVEGKASKPTFLLLSQCLRWMKMCNGVRAVVPHQPMSDEFLLAVDVFGSKGVCLTTVVGNSVVSHHPMKIDSEGEGIKQYLTDANRYEDGRFAKAGSAGGRRASKVNEEYAAIEGYVASNPGCTAAEAAREGGMKASALLKLIKQGKVKLKVENIGGKSSLFPQIGLD